MHILIAVSKTTPIAPFVYVEGERYNAPVEHAEQLVVAGAAEPVAVLEAQQGADLTAEAAKAELERVMALMPKPAPAT